jgi:hypothetical protein
MSPSGYHFRLVSSNHWRNALSIEQEKSLDIAVDLVERLAAEKFAIPQAGNDNAQEIDLALALKQALSEPLFYPSIGESVFPGDTIAIALQSDLPNAKSVLIPLLEILGEANVAVADIVVVIAPVMAEQFGIEAALYEIAEETQTEGKRPPVIPVEFEFTTINFQVHDSENQTGLSYLAANEEGDPVHVNRLLVDADVVLPIGSPKPGEVNQQTNCIYPDFSSSAVMERFANRKGSFVSRWQEIELANDSLGAFFAIQTVCGPGDSIREVIAGARKDATNAARESTNNLWRLDWEGTAGAAVATIESTSTAQTWEDFSSALITASRVTKSDGPIVIWSNIETPPDRNMRKALTSQFEGSISTKLTKTLQHVAAIVNERPVFLKSGLKRNAVEELGLGFVESPDEVVRISASHEDGLLIRDAHKCQVNHASLENETESTQ